MDKKRDTAISSFLGFKLQEQFALLLVIKLRSQVPNAIVTIEEIDDVAVIKKNYNELYQIKNFITSNKKLTLSSTDVWNTLENWVLKYKKKEINSTTELILFVNSKIKYKKGDIIFELNQIKSEEDACDKYNELYNLYILKYKNSKNKSIKKYLDCLFMEENRDAFIAVIKKFKLLDRNVSQIDELNKYISMYCTFGTVNSNKFIKARNFIISEYQTLIYESSESNKGILIDVEKFHQKIDDFSDKYNNLCSFISTTSDEEIDINGERSLSFVKQLEYIEIDEERLEKSKYDYYKTKKDVYNYLHDSLIIDTEYENFKMRLLRRWDGFKIQYNDCKSISDAKSVFGLCTSLQENLANRQIEQDYFCIGSCHILVEDDCKTQWVNIREVENND